MKAVFNTISLSEMSGDLSGNCQWLEKYLTDRQCDLVTTDWDQIFYQQLRTAEIVITQGFTGAELTNDHIASAENLQLVVVAGSIHSHIQHDVLLEREITMVKIPNTGLVSLSEQQFLAVLSAVRTHGEDLKGKRIGLIGAGYTARALVELLQPFGVVINYFDQHQWESAEEDLYRMTWFPSVEMAVENCDIIVSNCPLEYGGILNTEKLFNESLIAHMKPGVILLVASPEPTIDRWAVNKALDQERIKYFAGPNILNQANQSYQHEISTHIKSMLDHWFEKTTWPDAWLLTHQGQRGIQPDCDCFNLAGWHA